MNAEKIASNFIDWLIDFEYMNEQDKEIDFSDMVKDIKATYDVAPRLVNLIRDISDR